MAHLSAGERSILKALESSSTCTTETLLNIKSILLPRDGTDDKENKRGRARAKSVAVTADTTKAVRQRTKAHTRQVTVVEAKANSFPVGADKVNFAFQVVNSCIRMLSQLAKQHVMTKRGGRADGNVIRRKSTDRAESMDLALRGKSHNTQQYEAVEETAISSSDPRSLATTVAACAFAALSFLQRHYPATSGKDKTYQVENGTLAVITKCIDLELANLALEQLQVLKRRLQAYLPGEAENMNDETQGTHVFLSLLSFSAEVKVSSMFQFIIKIHQHVWQLVRLQTSPAVLEALTSSEHVHCSVLRDYVSTMEDRAKAGKLLGAMSRLLLHLSTMSGLSVVSALTLRFSAFTCQIEAAECSTGLSEEEAGSVSAKLRRCAESLLKSFKVVKDNRLESARMMLFSLLQVLEPYAPCAQDISYIKQISKSLAIETGKADGDLKQSRIAPVNTSSLSEILRIATGCLSVTKLENAVLGLQRPLPDDKVAADRLLVDIAGFRRALHKSVLEERISGAQSFPAAAACMSLLRQYLGRSLDRRKDQGKVLDDRVRVGKKFLKPFISTLIVCCLHHEEPESDMFSALEVSCSIFLEVIEHDGTFAEERFGNSRDPHSSIFITISKLCYKLWNSRVAKHGAADELAVRALDTSIKVMEPWTLVEKEATAVTQRLRFLMDAQISQGRWSEASRTFERFLCECQASGYLAELGSGAATRPLNALRTADTMGALVYRCIQLWTTIMRKTTLSDKQVIFSNLELGAAEQGVLLEWQFELLGAYVSQERSTNLACVSFLQLIQQRLLFVYDQKSFPVRRLRVVGTTARLLSSIPDLCDFDTIATEVATSLCCEDLGLDFELTDHVDYLQANARVTAALLEPHSDEVLATIRSSLDIYRAVFASFDNVDDAVKIVGDVSLLHTQHFEAIADFYAFRRDVGSEVQTLEIVLQVLLKLPCLIEQQLSLLCRLADSHILVGHIGKALGVLELCETMMKLQDLPMVTHVRYLLSRATYFMAVSKHGRCKEILQLVAQRVQEGGEQNFIQKAFASSSISLCILERRLVARAAYLSAEVDFRAGCIASARRSCNIAKSMLFKIWTSVEHTIPRDVAVSATIPLSSCLNSNSPSAIGDVQPIVVTRSYSHLDTSKLRVLVPELLQVAMLEMSLHDFRGSYHDAFTTLKHVNKIANHVGAGAACLSDISAADLYVRSLPLNDSMMWEQKIQDARTRIDMVDAAFMTATKTLDVFRLDKVKANILAAEEEPEAQIATLEATLKILQGRLQDARDGQVSLGSGTFSEGAESLAEQLACMALSEAQKSRKPTRTKSTVPKKPKVTKTTKKPTVVELAKKQSPEPQDGMQSVPLLKWHATLLRESSIAALAYHAKPGLDDLARLIETAGSLIYDAAGAIDQSVTRAQLLIHQVAGEMASNINFNALQDCILSIPAPQKHANATQEMSVSLTKTAKKSKAAKSLPKTQSTTEPAFNPLLQSALEGLRHTWIESCAVSSVATLRHQGHLISSISATASACLGVSSVQNTHPLVLAYYNDYPAIRSRLLDRQAEDPEVEKLNKDDLRQWPSLSLDLPLPQEHRTIDRAAFQEEYVDIIPELWTVVSMSLTEDKTAMKLIRYRSGQSPFCLRIPFAYRESDDLDEEVLDMGFVYERLRSIIKQHEFAPAESRTTNQADFKKQWWQKKRELDVELHSLLSDVEDQWFVAVKGIFASVQCDAQALSNFQAQLQGILRQYCPIKKIKGKSKSFMQSLDLEPRILELFVGLGNPDCEVEVECEDGFVKMPLAESPALSNGIHELVRLVLEGLQFAGESIAIDEVDMDNVIVKVIDALRAYHGLVVHDPNGTSHTVLVLDNQLHGFPWESLPCLRYKSVSRLPSLLDLRDRIVAARLGSQDGGMVGKTISRDCGVSLLNPSGDLMKTAQRFQPWLPKLPQSWTHMRQAPDDNGWRDLLSENDLFLYVGHGSTSQYVRPRVVKRLGYNGSSATGKSTCAVSWLIGCGSVAVEDLGSFEPSGMVLHYLAAGSPAVLGALWDVGDIDADHFSITAADYWGLWDESNKGLDPKNFPARKRILNEKRAMGRDISMCEAVTKSRCGCKLPYLNGAAFVVYGIPVFLQ